ncbi:MAG: T9SS type A sorting domain-containing protein [Saprospiraceae bacterium]|nr:T9SS type A sorting domain-containing protein [Saprospiraceae bacterium]
MKRILICTICAFLAVGLAAQEPAIKVIQNGNVGIGKSDPETKLDVDGNVKVSLNKYLVAKRTDGRIHQMLGMDGFNSVVFNRSSLTQGMPSSLLFGIGSGRVFDMRNGQNIPVFRLIEATGNVGIGTVNPDAKLTVNGDASKPGGGMWSVFNDSRVISDSRPFDHGLETVLQIEPIFFSYNDKLDLPQSAEYVGVEGAHMQELAPFMIKEASTSDSKGRSLDTYLSYDGTALPYMLVNAVKEQQEIIDDQEARIAELEAKLDKILNAVETGVQLNPTEQTEVNLSADGLSKLEQNRPNPFSGSTLISYEIDADANKAAIEIMNTNGILLKTVPLNHKGEGQLKVNASDLPAGAYYYQLRVDGQLVGSKKMIVN